MANRRQSPDILAQVMEGNLKTIEPESNKVIEPENNKATTRVDGKAIKQVDLSQEIDKADRQESNIATTHVDNKAMKQEGNNTMSLVKEKTTFNISVSTLEKLDNLWMNLRKRLKDKGRVTKTLIVERAIELAIQEFEKEGEVSALYQDISHQ